jgi:hypothetical protein
MNKPDIHQLRRYLRDEFKPNELEIYEAIIQLDAKAKRFLERDVIKPTMQEYWSERLISRMRVGTDLSERRAIDEIALDKLRGQARTILRFWQEFNSRQYPSNDNATAHQQALLATYSSYYQYHLARRTSLIAWISQVLPSLIAGVLIVAASIIYHKLWH